jgi:hypothetical protein
MWPFGIYIVGVISYVTSDCCCATSFFLLDQEAKWYYQQGLRWTNAVTNIVVVLLSTEKVKHPNKKI